MRINQINLATLKFQMMTRMRMRNRAILFVLLFGLMILIAFPASLSAQAPGSDDSDKPDKNDSGHFFTFKFKNKPSILIGQFARIDVKSKWHFDYEKFSPRFWNPPGTLEGISPQTDYFSLTRARFA